MPPGKHKSKLKTANAPDIIKHRPIPLFLSRYLFPILYSLDKDLVLTQPIYPIKNTIHSYLGIFLLSIYRQPSLSQF